MSSIESILVSGIRAVSSMGATGRFTGSNTG
jgi:hypothetical protein